MSLLEPRKAALAAPAAGGEGRGADARRGGGDGTFARAKGLLRGRAEVRESNFYKYLP